MRKEKSGEKQLDHRFTDPTFCVLVGSSGSFGRAGEFLLPGKEKRPDRICLKLDEALIVDF